MGLLDFFRTPKPYCLEVKRKDGTIVYVSNIFIHKAADVAPFDKESLKPLYNSAWGDALVTDQITGKSEKFYFYYEVCPEKKNALQFAHISKMREYEKPKLDIIFKSVENTGGECKFVFHNQD